MILAVSYLLAGCCVCAVDLVDVWLLAKFLTRQFLIICNVIRTNTNVAWDWTHNGQCRLPVKCYLKITVLHYCLKFGPVIDKLDLKPKRCFTNMFIFFTEKSLMVFLENLNFSLTLSPEQKPGGEDETETLPARVGCPFK